MTSLAVLALAGSASAYRDPPPDSSVGGPFGTATAEYRLPAVFDTEVHPTNATEVWARVYRPEPLPDNTPLLVFLHGNHATCGFCASGYIGYNCADGSARLDTNSQYTISGTCPPGYIVAPSHEGYAHIADQLASWGYLVVSVNVNRGINAAPSIPGDGGLNLVRGRMILKHLSLLSAWNQGTEPTPDSLEVDLTGKIDFSNIGLMGHSRGGEGMRAAYQQYRDSGSIWAPRIGPANFRAMFEIGPVDGQTSRTLTPDSLFWNVILPMCDGDVSNLQGVRPYDRVRFFGGDDPPTLKGTSTVYGANHNYFNTQWQVSDSGGCSGPGNPPIFVPGASVGSPQQQQIGLSLVSAMFRGAVGPDADPVFLNTFDPLYLLPMTVTDVTRVDRGFNFSPRSPEVSLVLERFASLATLTRSNLESFSLTVPPEHYPATPTRQAGLVRWNVADPEVYLQSDWAAGPTDISTYSIFEFDVDREINTLNPLAATNFHVQLVQGDGSLCVPVSAADYVVIDGPQGGPGGRWHSMLQTARIPVTDFTGCDLTQVAGVRFTFDDTESGSIYLSTVSVDTAPPLVAGAPSNVARAPAARSAEFGASSPNVYSAGNAVNALRAAQSIDYGAVVLVDLTSATPIDPRDELTIVNIAGHEFEVVEYPTGDARQIRVTIPQAEFNRLPDGAEITVQYGRAGSTSEKWIFPGLNKTALNR